MNTETSSLMQLVNQMTIESVLNLRKMIELGKKPDGQRLSKQERESCLEALLLWEANHLPEHQRSGYIEQSCKNKKELIEDLPLQVFN